MKIKNVNLVNFRNMARLDWTPDLRLNVIIGDNAQGKTSVLESIYLAVYLKSFRSARNENLIQYNKRTAVININLRSFDIDRIIKVIIRKESKEVHLNDKKPDSYQDFFSGVSPVLFSPEELQLIRGAPGGRRTFLDRAVFQGNKSFIQASIEYARHLRQRNKLLKEGRTSDEIYPWTLGLIRTGIIIRAERIHYLERLNPFFMEVFRLVTDNRESAEIEYPFKDRNIIFLENESFKEFERSREREIIWKQTLVGPHRDDPVFMINGKPLRQYASQGQQRSFILAFKIAQIIELEQRTGEIPVLLLDDLTSELDQKRQKFFLDFIQQRSGQVFITTTDVDPLIRRGLTEGSFYAIEGGVMRSVAN